MGLQSVIVLDLIKLVYGTRAPLSNKTFMENALEHVQGVRSME